MLRIKIVVTGTLNIILKSSITGLKGIWFGRILDLPRILLGSLLALRILSFLVFFRSVVFVFRGLEFFAHFLQRLQFVQGELIGLLPVVVLARWNVLRGVAESSLGVEHLSDGATSETRLSVHETDEEFTAVRGMRKPIVISELELGKLLVHVRAPEVENGVSCAFWSIRQIRMHASCSGWIENDSLGASLLVWNSFQTMVELLAGNCWWERVESVGALTILVCGLRRLQQSPL